MRIMKSLLLASCAAAAICASGAADAQTIIRGGGATFPSIAYRNLFDCVSFQPFGPSFATPAGVSTPLSSSCVGTGPNFAHPGFLVLYAPVGSGAGKAGFVKHSVTAASLGSNAWATKVSGNIPYVDNTYASAWPYPDATGIQFAGSDDLLLPSDVSAYNTNGGPAKYGNILFMPAVIGPVAISINPTKDGAGSAWLVPPNTIKLSRKSLCGIFSGHITAWNASSITADNGGAVGTGQITVIVRSDGSGTNFLLTNALSEQCRSVYGATTDDGPVPSVPALALYSFPWTDKAASSCPALPVVGANQNAWPTLTDGCGATVPIPAGSAWSAQNGNGGVAGYVKTTNGAIGYNTADQVQPIVALGPQTAQLQSQYDIDNSTGLYHLPTAAGAQAAMAAVTPVLDDTTRANPLNWAAQGTVPNPALPGSYPIAGFSWFLLYQCYANATVQSNLYAVLNWHYTSGLASSILADNGMALPPATWLNEVSKLWTTTSPLGHNGDGGVCNAKSGA